MLHKQNTIIINNRTMYSECNSPAQILIKKKNKYIFRAKQLH